MQADISDTGDMVRLREKVESEWQGVDTVIVCAGVSALLPLMEVAGLKGNGSKFDPPQADVEGIQRTVDVANAAARVNYIGPLISAVTFLPILQSSSVSPSIVLISSLGAIIPAPTRSIYGSTKSASLMLYQALSIEHSAVTFTLCIPTTVEGNFRASAVDGGSAVYPSCGR
ncbi:hypothetical protein SCP_1300720 [Sparassis crispa]|uniref:NAD(P)-binding protein n=1 Tax=Sparassis crispa TaxID=139825 RepID=A0A401H1F0_9APHY|nr:hypothetical protein SCP_1300720 [Sparassis crispa]GBE88257.1 hypothetical protein SCP_1300720 [Sparassis crispa]